MTSIPNKDIVFYIVLTVIILLMNILGSTIYSKNYSKQTLISSIIAISIFTSVVLIMSYLCINKILYKEPFHFEVTPAKKCYGFPFFQQGNKELTDYCQDLLSTPEGQQEYADVNCPNGFGGRPVHFKRDYMTNDKWQNNICSPPFEDPQVL